MSGELGGDFAHILGRELDALAEQVGKYPDDASLWRVEGSILNSAGTLVLHLVGNLSHYVGAVLGGSGYVRDRDAEFQRRDVPRSELLAMIGTCKEDVVSALEALDDDQVTAAYPGQLPPFLTGATTHRFLVHLTGHFQWHKGQVDYHRRILTG